eukprot:1540181-Rhodomonas_salina.1
MALQQTGGFRLSTRVPYRAVIVTVLVQAYLSRLPCPPSGIFFVPLIVISSYRKGDRFPGPVPGYQSRWRAKIVSYLKHGHQRAVGSASWPQQGGALANPG